MISKVISSAPYNNGGAYARGAGPGGSGVVRIRSATPQAINSYLEPSYGSWALGTGVPVDTTGAILFNESSGSFNGALKDVQITNLGPSTVYIGFNSLTPTVAGGYPLSSGMSYKNTLTQVNTVWAITNGGVAIVDGLGIYDFNQKII